jgi:uncharacterized protein
MPQIQTSGLAFPLQITTGKHTVVSGVDLIQASLKTIISWPLFTRYYAGQFGSRLYELLEEPNDDILVNLIRRFVIDAVSTWEQRIELKSLNISRPGPEKVTIELTYNVKESNFEGSFYYNYSTN